MNKSIWSLPPWRSIFVICNSALLHGKIHAWKDSCHFNFLLMSYSLGHQEQEVKDVLEGSKFLGLLSFVWMTSGPFPLLHFFPFRRRGQRQGRCVLHRSPMVHGCSWWSPMNLRQVLPFIF